MFCAAMQLEVKQRGKWLALNRLFMLLSYVVHSTNNLVLGTPMINNLVAVPLRHDGVSHGIERSDIEGAFLSHICIVGRYCLTFILWALLSYICIMGRYCPTFVLRCVIVLKLY